MGFVIFHYREANFKYYPLRENYPSAKRRRVYLGWDCMIVFPTPPVCWHLFWLALHRPCAFGHDSCKYTCAGDLLYQGGVFLQSPAVSCSYNLLPLLRPGNGFVMLLVEDSAISYVHFTNPIHFLLDNSHQLNTKT